jgi:hypothetical protein
MTGSRAKVLTFVLFPPAIQTGGNLYSLFGSLVDAESYFHVDPPGHTSTVTALNAEMSKLRANRFIGCFPGLRPCLNLGLCTQSGE